MNRLSLTRWPLAVLLLAGAGLWSGCADDALTTEDAAPPSLALEESADLVIRSARVRAPAPRSEIEILESNSDYVNHLYLVSPGPETFLGTDDEWGRVVALPRVRWLEELVFEIRPFDPVSGSFTGDRWRTGPGARNADGEQHARVDWQPGQGIFVMMEDLPAAGWGEADEPNFVDAVFVVRPAFRP